MNNLLFQLITFLILLVQIHSNISPHLYQPHNTSFYQCVKAAGYNWISNIIASDSKQISQQYLQAIYNARNAGLKVDIVIQVCKSISPEQQAQMIVFNIIPQAYSIVWAIPTIISSDKTCNWLQTYQENCQYMVRFRNQMLRFNKNVGFAANSNIWIQYFGGINNCPQLGSSPLYWAPNDLKLKNPTFDDFKQFGGWILPYYKLYNDTKLCGSEVGLNYFLYR